MPTAEQVDRNALDVATLYLCGANPESCREAQMPEVVRKLIFEGEIFSKRKVHESARKVLQTIHQARACIYSNGIRYNPTLRNFQIHLKDGRARQTQVQLDPEQLKRWLNECDKDMVAISISLPNHANMLIIDRARKQVEHFEPHGPGLRILGEKGNTQFRVDVKALIEKIGLHDYTYLSPRQTCPDIRIGVSHVDQSGKKGLPQKIGIQSFLNKSRPGSEFAGTCAIWSLWYAHVRLSNPSMDAKEAYTQAMSLAAGLNNEKYPEGLHKTCERALSMDGRQYCNGPGAPKGWKEMAIQLWRKKCKPACDYVETLRKGGLGLEEFIIRFTLQLISLLQIEVVTGYRRSCRNHYTFRTREESDASMKANRKHCPTEEIELIVSGDGRMLYTIEPDQTAGTQKTRAGIPTPDSASYVVYGRPGCLYCEKAEQLIQTHELDGLYVSKPDYDSDAYHKLIRPRHPGHYTVPVVFFNNKFIGGFDEFQKHVEAQLSGTPSPKPTEDAAAKPRRPRRGSTRARSQSKPPMTGPY